MFKKKIDTGTTAPAGPAIAAARAHSRKLLEARALVSELESGAAKLRNELQELPAVPTTVAEAKHALQDLLALRVTGDTGQDVLTRAEAAVAAAKAELAAYGRTTAPRRESLEDALAGLERRSGKHRRELEELEALTPKLLKLAVLESAEALGAEYATAVQSTAELASRLIALNALTKDSGFIPVAGIEWRLPYFMLSSVAASEKHHALALIDHAKTLEPKERERLEQLGVEWPPVVKTPSKPKPEQFQADKGVSGFCVWDDFYCSKCGTPPGKEPTRTFYEPVSIRPFTCRTCRMQFGGRIAPVVAKPKLAEAA